ncbi:hypothetical protein ACOSP7_030185 [Xanthoceras sorbifolium]
MSCITSVEYKVIMNGEIINSFSPRCGIRQGDPISPYIFVLCMEKLSHIINSRVVDRSWKAIKVSRKGPDISHLFFTNDLILFGQATSDQASVMKDCIDVFCKCSGQQTVCLLKNLGGLKVKQMEPLNQALLAKLSWWMHQGEDSLWCNMLEAKYLGGSSVTGRSGGCRASNCWRSINHGFKLLNEGLVWRIGDGQSVSFWNDSWVPDLGVLKPYATSWLSSTQLLEKVCSFFCGEGWNYAKLNFLLPSHIVQKIISVHVGRDFSDKVIWGLIKDGSFNVKSVYIANLAPDNCVKWKWSFLWKLNLPPKICFFLWTLLHGKSLTNLQRMVRGISSACSCSDCGEDCEDLNHLFRVCPVALKVWEGYHMGASTAEFLSGE